MSYSDTAPSTATKSVPGLKKIPPYWYPYTTMAKARWLGRELLEVVSTEFRDRSMEYYRYALESGVTTVNGEVASPDTLIRNGDRIENVVHRHEPPVTSTPVKILLHDVEREFIVVDKPGSIPVHASGRYFRNTLVEILENDFGFEKAYTVNRLDRLTSGLMIVPLSYECARAVSAEFMAGTVRKVYIARCKGKFPEEEIVCEEPLLTVDRQMGLNIVHPEGKHAKTIFQFVRYDANTDSSVVRCQPLTGRSHQIRVHLQYLGHPIANDPVYSEIRIWGDKLGKGGVDTTPSNERSAPAPPPHITLQDGNPEIISSTPPRSRPASPVHGSPTNTERQELAKQVVDLVDDSPRPKLLPRETGHDIGMGSPVPLSSEAVGVITRLRNMKDEDEDWGRWRDVVFRAKGALVPPRVTARSPLPPHNKRKRGGPTPAFKKEIQSAKKAYRGSKVAQQETIDPQSATLAASHTSPPTSPKINTLHSPVAEVAPLQLSTEEALAKLSVMERADNKVDPNAFVPTENPTAPVQAENTYCPECYLPLHPDPKPEKLYIFLHALRYTTSLGTFETEVPEWTREGWVWDRDGE